MGRKKFVRKRELLPDPKFNDVVVAKFINSLMNDGKRSTAERILYLLGGRWSDRSRAKCLGRKARPGKGLTPARDLSYTRKVALNKGPPAGCSDVGARRLFADGKPARP